MSHTTRNRARRRRWIERRACRVIAARRLELVNGARALLRAFLNPKPLPESKVWREWGGR